MSMTIQSNPQQSSTFQVAPEKAGAKCNLGRFTINTLLFGAAAAVSALAVLVLVGVLAGTGVGLPIAAALVGVAGFTLLAVIVKIFTECGSGSRSSYEGN